MMVIHYTFVNLPQGTKKSSLVVKNRFTNPSTRGIMTAILLTPGPVATKTTVKGLSRIFNNAINIPKFLAAARKLQDIGLGSLASSSGKFSNVFVKKPPEEAGHILVSTGNEDLCSAVEYEERFKLPSPSTVSTRMRTYLIESGSVPRQYFPLEQQPQPQPGPEWFFQI